jgi:hypothetical protein
VPALRGSDEEHVQVLVEVGGQSGRFPERAFNYVLLVLACGDTDQKSGIAEGDAGWLELPVGEQRLLAPTNVLGSAAQHVT